MNTIEILDAARVLLARDDNPSARLCLEDAVTQFVKGNDNAARAWAVRSIRHSVGIFNPAYKQTQQPNP